MNVGIIYALTAAACLFQLLLIYNRSVRTKYKETIDRKFCNLLIFCSAFCFVDMCWGICDARFSFINSLMFNMVTYSYHSLCALSAFFWFGYIVKYMGIVGTSKKYFNVLRFLFLTLQSILIIVNTFTHSSFYISATLEYKMSTLRFYMYLVQFFYYIVILVYSGFHIIIKPDDRKRLHQDTFVFSFIPLTFGIGQYLFYDVAMYSLGFTISGFVIYAFNLTAIREDHLAQLAYEQTKFALTDALTGILNRRAYENDQATFPRLPPEEHFVFISMDLDGLKKTNDQLGHEAGDEIIVGAAECIQICFGSYGRVYRIGGDEFAGILFVSCEQLEKLKRDFEQATMNWKGKKAGSLHISAGYASKDEFPGKTVPELAKIADERMYKEKARYYSSVGIDRREQAEAQEVLYSLYKKILKVNLTQDSYRIVIMDSSERNGTMGFSDRISEWLHDFGTSGHVHKDDLEHYLQKTDMEYLRKYFADGKASLNIQYRRMCDGSYRNSVMEFMPAKDYSSENQNIFLFVKILD